MGHTAWEERFEVAAIIHLRQDRMMKHRNFLFVLALAVLLIANLAQPSAAQEATAESEAGEEGAQPSQPAVAPYDDRLLRLSEIVGSMHYLDETCASSGDGVSWRDTMNELIETEAADPQRKSRMTAAFNRGYRTFSSLYVQCTDAARAAQRRYRSEGATLASEIVARFGN